MKRSLSPRLPRSIASVVVLLGLTLPLVLPAALASQTAETQKVRGLLDEAEEAMQRGELRRAAKRLEKADHVAEGRSGEALVLWAHALHQLARFEEAMERAGQALDLDLAPALRAAALHGRARSRLAILEMEQQEFLRSNRGAETPSLSPEALELIEQDLRQALDLPGDPDPAWRDFLVYVLRHQGKKEEGKALLAELVGADRASGSRGHLDSLQCLVEHWLAKEGVQRFTLDGGVTFPKLLRRTDPQYTEAARAAGLEGVVVLEVVLDEAGKVQCVGPLVGLPLGMTESVMASVRRWEYKPALKDGVPVKVLYGVSISFSIGR